MKARKCTLSWYEIVNNISHVIPELFSKQYIRKNTYNFSVELLDVQTICFPYLSDTT